MGNVDWRVRRAALGLRQRDVADRVGITQGRYSLLERGESFPTDEEKQAIDCALRLPAETAKEVAHLRYVPRSS